MRSGGLDPRMRKIGHSVRQACEILFPRRRGLHNLCSVASYSIVRIAREMDIEAEFMGGTFRLVNPINKPEFGNPAHIQARCLPVDLKPHAWVLHRANYIDITLTQFIPATKCVAVLKTSDVRYSGIPEPLEFVELALPIIGSSQLELETVISLAARYFIKDAG
jgi:hypothetical protein